MAGAVFPPDILGVRVAEHIALSFTFNGKECEYNEASEWLRARAKLPRVQLHRSMLEPLPNTLLRLSTAHALTPTTPIHLPQHRAVERSGRLNYHAR